MKDIYNWIRVPLYRAFTAFTPTIPKFYWDTYSQEERIHAICKELDKIVEYCNMMGIQINYVEEEIEKLANEFEEWKNGGYDEIIQDVVSKWVDLHMQEIIEQAVKMVFFGLTQDGYFCAFIPDSWKEIEFDTGFIYSEPEYGRLILEY